MPGLTERRGKKSIIRRSSKRHEIEDFIMKSYPSVPLHLIRFSLATSSKGRKIDKIENWSTVEDLEKHVGSGQLYIIPHTDIPLPLTVR